MLPDMSLVVAYRQGGACVRTRGLPPTKTLPTTYVLVGSTDGSPWPPLLRLTSPDRCSSLDGLGGHPRDPPLLTCLVSAEDSAGGTPDQARPTRCVAKADASTLGVWRGRGPPELWASVLFSPSQAATGASGGWLIGFDRGRKFLVSMAPSTPLSGAILDPVGR